MEKFLKLFTDLFDETDFSLFTVNTKFKELEEWSSLTALSTIAMIDEEYDVALKGDDIRNAVTIEDLFNTIKSKQE
jgi:acyl carrier protein